MGKHIAPFLLNIIFRNIANLCKRLPFTLFHSIRICSSETSNTVGVFGVAGSRKKLPSLLINCLQVTQGTRIGVKAATNS